MLPLNPREFKRLMRRFGVNVEELNNVKSVTITLDDKEIIIRSPQVVIMKVQGQQIYQVIGGNVEEVKVEEEVEEVTFSEDDIKFVMEQTGVSREEAVEALKKANGDIAQAVLLLTSKT